MLRQRRTIGGGVPPSVGSRVALLLSVLARALTPTIANAAPAASWEHEDDSHNGWTAISAGTLASGDSYVLDDGYYYFSRPFVAYKTMSVMVNKEAIPKEIRKKMGL